MAQVKALVTRRGVPRSDETRAGEASEAESVGLTVEQLLSQGALVTGEEEQLAELESQGYRVKLLPDADLIELGDHRIDVTRRAPRVPSELEVPQELRATWIHHLVQLAGPPSEEWIREIDARGVDVVEPISSFGLFVVGTPEEVADLESLPFVRWTGPFKPAYRLHPNLAGRKGRIRYVSIGVYPESEVASVRKALERAKAAVVTEAPPTESYRGEYATFVVEVSASQLPRLAAEPGVRWLEYASPEPGLDGEREAQIVAENVAGAPLAPVTGYQPWLGTVGLGGGTGVTVAICDTGIDAGAANNATGHVDIRGRQIAFVDYSGGISVTDTDGHGTHVTGIAVGNAASGQTEAAAPNDFLWGQGVAPQASYVAQNALLGPWPPANFGTLTQDAVTNGAQVVNNSWFDGGPAGSGYTANARRYDQLVRDPDEAAAGLQNLAIVFSAGNSGGNPSTITPPHEAKNIIVVGNSLTFRPGTGFPSEDIRGIAGSSSRGPAMDGRTLPNVVAPGTNVSSTWAETGNTGIYGAPIAGTGTPDPANPGNTINQYMFMTGTSMAAPHVTGACALLIEWWRARTGGRNPSPALLKALLVNGAEDLVGGENWRVVPAASWTLHSGSIFKVVGLGYAAGAVVQGNATIAQVGSVGAITAGGQWFYDAAADTLYVRTTTGAAPGTSGAVRIQVRAAAALAGVPDTHQGWGRVSLENVILQSPDSDRGPKIFTDQRNAFTANGQEYVIRVAPVDAARPLRVTLVWTDAPGAAGSNPALVNDLDLEVTEVATSTVFKGNVLTNGFSTSGGSFDNRNNVECVLVQNPAGVYDVTVVAANIAGNALPPFNATPYQDFALVVDNAEVPAASPVSVVPVIDRSGSMVSSGYVDVTKTSSRQFVDFMRIDDRVGVVSFGSTAQVEYPPGASPSMQTITGQPVRDAAKAEIQGTAFGGATFMGGGIDQARNLLGSTPGRAIVLLSDGYDNQGFVPGNPTAMAVVATLPPGLPVHTCAMGPASDQALLELIATTTGARYYFMPTIDDLFEIYNYIRGRVSGTAIVANQSAMASTARVGAFVDAVAEEATFTVSWADTGVRYVAGEPRKRNEMTVRLRDPRGRLLPSGASYVRRTEGAGYVVFEVLEPAPGQWFIEVTTPEGAHLRFTAACLVRSPIRLDVAIRPAAIAAGVPMTIAAQVRDGRRLIRGFKSTARIDAPLAGLKTLQRKHAAQLGKTRPKPAVGGDKLPRDIARLLALRDRVLAAKGVDLFARVGKRTALREAAAGGLPALGLGSLVPPGAPVVGPHAANGSLDGLARADGAEAGGAGSGVAVGSFAGTAEAGSYNVVVSATGTSPVSGTRFARKELVSVLVR